MIASRVRDQLLRNEIIKAGLIFGAVSCSFRHTSLLASIRKTPAKKWPILWGTGSSSKAAFPESTANRNIGRAGFHLVSV